MNDRVLKSTEAAKVSKNGDAAFSYVKTVEAKIVSIDLKTLTQTYLCLVCSNPVNINNAVADRNHTRKFKNVITLHPKSIKADVEMVILNGSGQLRSSIDVSPALIEKSISLFQIPPKRYCYETYKQIF